METRIALIGIIVENPASIEALNHLLHEYGNYIIGRMGIPYREKKGEYHQRGDRCPAGCDQCAVRKDRTLRRHRCEDRVFKHYRDKRIKKEGITSVIPSL